MRKSITLILSTFFFFYCSSIKYNEQSNNSGNRTVQLPASVSTSNGFRIFWKDIESDSRGFQAMDEYKPSAALISKYALRKINNQYRVSGFIQLNDDFDFQALRNINGQVTDYSATFKSFSIPVNKIVIFVHLKGIRRIEMNIRINTINQ
jgi:hypothetical protein